MGILMILFTLLGGITLSAQSSINGSFSRKAGTIETTLLTFITGFMFLVIFILFFGHGDVLAILEAPKWQLSAAFLGTMYLLLTVMAVPRIGVIATNIAGIIGQLVIGLIIDHFGWFNSLAIPLDLKRFFALLFMLIALYFIYKGNKRPNDEKQTQRK
ncbi:MULTISPECIES: DMT family transporter [unclassified Bacillus (in: firmicutes)]|uniref:DMT family transporter n=1 Tax=unclassified Bacillus (in: firmicutes) TaxID=185979 RepID=UPI00227F592D|nr:DMT family transporter [Bacillus sp. S20C3]MCY8204867.1 DMT family transporter [Bacillus sp. N12A5]MCY8288730.1 DMT family transporter [Bacillus sp. N13C7]MCY8637744.1 DMT family transporter [Bacillus sp. S17B2]MCY8720380.1 DMT family transporter [Bacillus sp. S10C12M]MCY9142261.1 DMT family transporter [Bacillus sp. T9C1]